MSRIIRPYLSLSSFLLFSTVTTSLFAQVPDWQSGYGPAGGNSTSLTTVDEGILLSYEFGGAWLSTDDGQTWKPYGIPELPTIIGQLGDGALLSITDDEAEAFRLTDRATSYELANVGLEGNAIWGIVAENDSVFLTTSAGLFVSGDHSRTWRKIDLGVTEIDDLLFVDTDGDRVLVAGGGAAWYAGKATDEFVRVGEEIEGTITSGAFDAQGVLVIATEDGLYRAADTGSTFELFSAVESGVLLVPPMAQEQDGTIWAMRGNGHVIRISPGGSSESVPIPTEYPYFIKVLSSGTVLVSDNGGGVWRSGDGGETFQIVGVPGKGARGKVMSGPDGELTAAMTYGVGRSTDNGETWTYFYEPIEDERGRFEMLDTYTLLDDGTILAVGENGSVLMWSPEGSTSISVGALSSDIDQILQGKDQVILALGMDGSFRSTDRGDTWEETAMNTRSNRSATVDADGNVWYLDWTVSSGTRIFRSDDGLTFSLVDGKSGFFPTSISRLPGGGVYVRGVGFNGETAIRTTDNGATWKDVQEPCPDVLAPAIEVPNGPGLLFATECGIYSWDQPSGSWSADVIKIPENEIIIDLAHTGPYLFMSGRDGEVYRLSSDELSVPLSGSASSTLCSNISLQGNELTLRFTQPVSSEVALSIYSITGDLIIRVSGLHANAGNGVCTFHLPSTLSSGTYLVSGTVGDAPFVGRLLTIAGDR